MSENAPLQLTHSLEDTWQAILGVIEANINKRSFSTWFAPVKALKITTDSIEVSVPNRFFCEWIDNHYSNLVQNAITQVLGDSKKVKYLVRNNNNSKNPSPYSASDWQHETEKRVERTEIDIPFSTRINDRYHFDNFIVGDSNPSRPDEG